jgi:hypothetical protein
MCNKGFTRLRNLEYHLTHNVCQQQATEYQRQCELSYRTCFICNPAKIFANRLTFRNHIKRIHQFNIIADYQEFISSINHWSAEIEDDWGTFICRNPQWMNREWLRSRWDSLTSEKNRFHNLWNINPHSAEFSQHRIAIEEDILSIITTFYEDLDQSNFDEISTIFTHAINNQEDELKWMDFFSALPADLSIWNFVYQRFIHFYKQIKSPYKQKKWIYPIFYWNTWIRWCRVIIQKSYFKSINIETLIDIYQVYFDISNSTNIIIKNNHSYDNSPIIQKKIILQL